MPYSDAKEINQDRRIAANSSAVRGPVMSGELGTTSLPAAPQALKFTTIRVDQGGIIYDAATGKFTVPEAGVYRITLNPFKRSATGATRLYIGLNTTAPTGANQIGHCYDGGVDFATMCLNTVINLEADDYIVFYLFQGTLHNTSGDRFNQFSIERIAI